MAMKILICSVPLRSDNIKTNYPPVGAMAVIGSLRAKGHEASFYDINLIRPSDEEIKSYLVRGGYDVVGISAVVSTSYKFVKRFSRVVREGLPGAAIIVGGRLAVSAEVLLRFARVDLCVIGEGEKTMIDLIDHLARHDMRIDDGMKPIKGLCFLDSGGKPFFTGYRQPLSVDEIADPDYKILEEYSDIDAYMISPFVFEQFRYDKRSYQAHRTGKKLTTVITSRGCVNRCTFCHRWQKGIRVFPVKRIISHIKYLMENYNVGFVSFGDESFGVSKRWLEDFIREIGPLDILYRIGGICCENADLSMLSNLRESGCAAVHFGFESGSARILRVMEKKADVEMNVKAARWTYEAGLQTVPALVVGMPGENYATVKETGSFLNRITEFSPNEPVLSINLLVTLPGTPAYEYARYKGLLGKTLEAEESYLLRISDSGGDSSKQLNLTDYPYFIVQSWVRALYMSTKYNYRKRISSVRLSLLQLFVIGAKLIFVQDRENAKKFINGLISHPLMYHMRFFAAPILVIYKNYKEGNKRLFASRCLEMVIWPFKRKSFKQYVSLRDFINKCTNHADSPGTGNVNMLRMGR